MQKKKNNIRCDKKFKVKNEYSVLLNCCKVNVLSKKKVKILNYKANILMCKKSSKKLM